MFIKASFAMPLAIVVALTTQAVYASPYSDAVLADNPVAYYRLGEASGTVAANSSTHGATLDGSYVDFGVEQTAPNTSSTIGEFGPRPGDLSGASTISGFESNNISIRSGGNTNAQVEVPDNNLLDITGALTLEAWVYRDEQANNGNNEGILGKFQGSTFGDNRSYCLYYNSRATGTNALSLGFVVNTTGAAAGNVDLQTGTSIPLGSVEGWMHLAAVYEPGARMAVYMNGVQIGERTTDVPAGLFAGPAPLWIGRQFSAAANTSFEGKIDEVAVYDTALSAATILAHYRAATQVPGDFDGDGDVDGADFVVWQTNFPTAEGATLAEGDADGDGDVDGADFVVWQTNFPTTPGPGIAPISEPTSLILIALGIAGFSRRTLRRGKPRSHPEIRF